MSGSRCTTHHMCYCLEEQLTAARIKLAAVDAVIRHARKISPSPSMHVYVADVEEALGRDVARPHKTGDNDGGSL